MTKASPRQTLRRCVPLLLCAVLAGCSWLRAAANRQSAEAQRLVEAAERAEQGGRLAEASSLLARAMELNPDDADIRNHLGEVLLSQGRKAEAVEHLEIALSRSPDDARGHARLARLFRDLE